MMQQPWDCAQPDEWLPQSLRLCWGSDSGSGGMGGGGDSGATTGGGDWGSSGSYDASGYNAGGDLGAWAGSAYDASTAGTGMGGGGDWGSFGDTSYASLNAPNAIFSDIGGPNPGVTTGGGDWGSAGAFSAAGTGGGPGGAMLGAAQGAASGLWSGGQGGGVFGDYGGGGGGYTGGGGGQQGGGSFGGFGTAGTLGASNAHAAAPTGPTGSAFADTTGGGSLAGPAGQISSGAPTTSEAQSESVGRGETTSDSDAAPSEEGDTSVAPSESQFGEPAAPEAEAGPSLSDGAPAGMIGGKNDAAPAAQPTADRGETEAAPSAFGPGSLAAALGLNDISVGPGPGLGINTGVMGLNTATETQAEGMGPGPGFAATGLQAALGLDSIASSPSNMPGVDWASVFEGAAGPDNTDWGSVFEGAAPTYDPMDSPFSTPTSTDTTYTLGGDPALSGQSADTSGSEVFEGAPSNQNVDWGSVFEGAAPVSEESAPSIEAFIAGGRTTDFGEPDWGSVFEGAPSNQNVDWDAVFEGAAPPPPPPPAPVPISIDTITVTPDTETPDAVTPEGITATEYNNAIDVFAALDAAAAAQNASDAAVFEGAAPAPPPTPQTEAPSTTSTIAGGRATDFQYAPSTQAPPPSLPPPTDAAHPYAETLDTGQPGAPPTTDNASTKGGDPALSGAAAAANAARDTGTSQQAGDAATQAAASAAINGASPTEQANAAAHAALQAGATPSQASAIGNAVYDAATGTPQPQQAPPSEQSVAPFGPEAPSTTSTITGGRTTDFQYAPSTQAPPPSLIEQAQQAPPSLPPPALLPTARYPMIDYRQGAPANAPSVPMPQARPADVRVQVGPFVALPGKPVTGVEANIPANPTTGMPAMKGIDTTNKGRNGATLEKVEAIITHFSGKFTIGGLVDQMMKGGAGYNIAIDRDGTAYQLRPNGVTAGHVGDQGKPSGKGNFAGYFNNNSIGVGAIAKDEADLTPAQIAKMKEIVTALGKTYNLPPSQVFGHAAVDSERGGGEGSTVAGWAKGLSVWPSSQAPTQVVDVPRPPTDIPPAANLPPPTPPPSAPAQPAPGRADIIQGRLVAARSNIINDLRADPGLKNTLDLIATSEVGSQGRAAVLGFLETAMNKAAAEASREGRAPTGRDLLQYLNNRSYFRDTLSKIESGKIKGGVLTDDILNEVGAGSNTTRLSTGNSSAKSPSSRFGGNPTNATIGREHYGVENYGHHKTWYNAMGAPAPATATATNLPPAAPAPPPAARYPMMDYRRAESPNAPPAAALPPPTMPLAPPTPPADIPAPEPPAPEPTLTPPSLGRADPAMLARTASQIATDMAAKGPRPTSQAEGQIALNGLARALAQAGIPAAVAQRTVTEIARAGARQAGYDPDGIASSFITSMTGTAMQGYQPARPGAVQGPPSPFAPGKQGALPFGQQYADLSQSLGRAAPSGMTGRPGEIGSQQPMFSIPGLERLSPITAPPAPSAPAGPGIILAGAGRDPFGVMGNIGAPSTGPKGTSEWEAPGLAPTFRDPDQSYPPAGPGDFTGQADQPSTLAPAGIFNLLSDIRALAKGGHVAKDEPVVVGEEGPETFVPDQPGTVVPHMPQPGKGKNVDRWPKMPAVLYPGRYGGVEREIERQTRAAQDPVPTLMDLIDSGQLRLTPNWHRMLNDPSLIALGQSRMGTVDAPAPEPAAEPPDPTSPMAQALGYGSIRRPMRIGRQSYSQ